MLSRYCKVISAIRCGGGERWSVCVGEGNGDASIAVLQMLVFGFKVKSVRVA